jgi:hypothetical protein
LPGTPHGRIRPVLSAIVRGYGTTAEGYGVRGQVSSKSF